MSKPRYEHDCTCCTFLGGYQEYDLYHCGQDSPTVIARFGELGDYKSGICFADTDDALGKARDLARESGLPIQES